MKVAIFGSTSEIAIDLIHSFIEYTNFECTLFSRNIEMCKRKVGLAKNKYLFCLYDDFKTDNIYDVIINFIGVGSPIKVREIGEDILELTQKYDSLIIDYLKCHSEARYIYLSSGAVFGRNFSQPVSEKTKAIADINDLNSSDWYSLSKLMAEISHRSLSTLNIYDVRVFSYFSHSQSLESGFFMSDLIQALVSNNTLETSLNNMTRDYITPLDFFNFILAIIESKPQNLPLDCYTIAPVKKFDLLNRLRADFGLKFITNEKNGVLNLSQSKDHYYSLNKAANGIGYLPTYSSIEGICKEIALINNQEK